MSNNRQTYINSVVRAGFVVSVVLLVSGAGYRILAFRLSSPVEGRPVSQQMLDRLPKKIGNWSGQDVPMDEVIIKRTDTDAHVSRRYHLENTFEQVWLWIASGIRARDLMPHRPEVCYTGNGWTLESKHTVMLTLEGDRELECNLMMFSRGTLVKERTVVLYYYIVNGDYYCDVSKLRSKIWCGSGGINYMAQVQVVSNVRMAGNVNDTEKTLREFATESALRIAELYREREETY